MKRIVADRESDLIPGKAMCSSLIRQFKGGGRKPMRHWSRFSAEVTCFIKLNCDKMAIEKVQLTYSDSVVARW